MIECCKAFKAVRFSTITFSRMSSATHRTLVELRNLTGVTVSSFKKFYILAVLRKVKFNEILDYCGYKSK